MTFGKTNIFLLAVLASLAVCKTAWASPVEYRGRVVESHTFPPPGTLEDRVGGAPAIVMDYFAAFDRDLIPEDKPYLAYTPTSQQMQEIRDVIGRLPAPVKDTVEPRILGIYFIENMIGSGWTEWFIGPDKEEYYIIALNAEVLQLGASEWITKKEKSIFIPDDPAMDLQIDIGADLTGFYYIFFHELAHVYDYIRDVTPGEPGQSPAATYELSRGKAARGPFPYMNRCWNMFSAPTPENDFPGRSDISFYGLNGGAKIKLSDAPDIYRRLENTAFVTLYGSQNWMEDFAEMFAAFMSSEIMRRPWTLTVTRNGEPLYTISNPLAREVLAKRILFMNKIMGIDEASDATGACR